MPGTGKNRSPNPQSHSNTESDFAARTQQSTTKRLGAANSAKRVDALAAQTPLAQQIWTLAVKEIVLELAETSESAVDQASFAAAVRAELAERVGGQLPSTLNTPSDRTIDTYRKLLSRQAAREALASESKSKLKAAREANDADLLALLRALVAVELRPHSRESAIDYVQRLNLRVPSKFVLERQQLAHQEQKQHNRRSEQKAAEAAVLQPARSDQNNAYQATFVSAQLHAKYSTNLQSYQATTDVMKAAAEQLLLPEVAAAAKVNIASKSTLINHELVEDADAQQQTVEIIGQRRMVVIDDSGSKKNTKYHVIRVQTVIDDEPDGVPKVYAPLLAANVQTGGTGQALDASKQQVFEQAKLDEKQIDWHVSDTASNVTGKFNGEIELSRQRTGHSLTLNVECFDHAIARIAQAGSVAMTGICPDYGGKEDSSRDTSLCNASADVFRSKPELMQEARKHMPGGQLAKPEATPDSRWLGIAKQLAWLCRSPQFVQLLARLIWLVCGSGEVKNLANKEAYVVAKLLDEVQMLATAITADFTNGIWKEATLWAQKHHGLRMAEVSPYLCSIWQRLYQMRALADALIASVEPSLLAQVRSEVEAWRSNKEPKFRPRKIKAAKASAPQEEKKASQKASSKKAASKKAASKKSKAKTTPKQTAASAASPLAPVAAAADDAAPPLVNAPADNGRWRGTFNQAPPAQKVELKQFAALLPRTAAFVADSGGSDAEFARRRAIVACHLVTYLDAVDDKFTLKMDQWDEPVMRAALMLDPNRARATAKQLHEFGQPECLASVAAKLNRTVAEVEQEAKAESYQGIVKLFVSAPLWQAVGELATSDDAADSEAVKQLKQFLLKCYAAVPVATAEVESMIKFVKGLDPAVRRNPQTVSRQMRQRVNRERSVLPVHLPQPRQIVTTASVANESPADGKDEKKADRDAMSDVDDFKGATTTESTDVEMASEADQGPTLPLKLARAKNNPFHVAHKPLTNERKTELNKQLGIHHKLTPQERKERESKIEKQVDNKQLEADVAALAKSLTLYVAKQTGEKRGRAEQDEYELDSDDEEPPAKRQRNGSASSSSSSSSSSREMPPPTPRTPSTRTRTLTAKRLENISVKADKEKMRQLDNADKNADVEMSEKQ